MPEEESRGLQFGRYFEEFAVGAVFAHSPGKTVTESDNNLFCLLTRNAHPLHSDVEYAKGTQHGRNVVVGTYVFSLVVGMSVADISGKAIANLGYEEVRHDQPVFVGDTLHARTTVLETRPSRSKSDRGIVRVRTEAFNQNGERVLQFTRSVLVPRGAGEV
jgi:acyl dehydratase